MNTTSVIASLSLSEEESFVKWTDSVYFKICDSAFVDKTAIEFTIKMYRPNENWNGDVALGDYDLYFTYNNEVFDFATTIPHFSSVNEEITDFGDVNAMDIPRVNLLLTYTRFHADRYGISGRTNNSGGRAYDIPIREWVELCRVRIPVETGDKNPEIRWDVTATGAMTAGGNPIIATLLGDVIKNPEALISTEGLVVRPEKACQGSEVRVYVKNAVTSGKGLTYTWRDSIAGELKGYELGSFNSSTTLKTGTSKDGRYEFEILGEGDTLLIKNTTAAVDGMFFSCVLSDPSIGKTIPAIGPMQVHLRDSVFGYFASTTPSVDYGMTLGIDTVKKCPGLPAPVNIHFLGAELDEVMGGQDWGDQLTVSFIYQDSDLNKQRGEIVIGKDELFPTVANGSLLHDLFTYEWKTEIVGKIYIESIKTSFCENGMSYALYDTLVIEEVSGELDYNLEKIVLGMGEKLELDTKTIDPKPYSIALQKPSLLGSYLIGPNKGAGYVTTYGASPTTKGEDTLIYKTTMEGCSITAKRPVEVVELSYLTMKVLLAGPYLGKDPLSGQDTMICENALKESVGYEIFPRNNTRTLLISPYDEECVLGEDIDNITDVKTNGTIFDWIYIELQEVVQKGDGSEGGGEVIDSLSAFVLSNGEVVGIDGEVVAFKNLKAAVYVRVRHRSHLEVISKPVKLPLERPNNTFVVDFSDKNKVLYGDKTLTFWRGVYCLHGGDLDGNNFITITDQNIILFNLRPQYQYDVTGDNFVSDKDNVIVERNMDARGMEP